jgi:hypothetical protein
MLNVKRAKQAALPAHTQSEIATKALARKREAQAEHRPPDSVVGLKKQPKCLTFTRQQSAD